MNPFIRYILGDLIGLNTRYLIHKLIGRPKSRDSLKGDSRNSLSLVDQQFANTLTGFAVLIVILLLFKLLL